MLNRYVISASVHVNASPSHVFATATDPAQVPEYADEIAAIDEVRTISEHERIVRSSIRVAGFQLKQLYRYRLRPPSRYSGVQEGGSLLRGFFNFRFVAEGTGTRVDHAEGIVSSIPGVATIVGWIYFRVLGHDDLDTELQRLKTLCERS